MRNARERWNITLLTSCKATGAASGDGERPRKEGKEGKERKERKEGKEGKERKERKEVNEEDSSEGSVSIVIRRMHNGLKEETHH